MDCRWFIDKQETSTRNEQQLDREQVILGFQSFFFFSYLMDCMGDSLFSTAWKGLENI
jgi:hypothetical protein